MIKQHMVRCFGTDENTGNEALVVQHDGFDRKERINFTWEQQANACVFVHTNTRENEPDLLSLDFYYGHAVSPLCIHATLAAGYIYFEENPEKTIVNAVTALQQKLEIIKIDDKVFVKLEPVEAPEVKIDVDVVQKLLGLKNLSHLKNFYLSSVGSPKLCVELDTLRVLNSLSPNLESILYWNKVNAMSGCYVYVKDSVRNSIVGRNFNHLTEDKEDTATGVSAGALTAHYKQDLEVKQGRNLQNSCVMYTKYKDGVILVGGRVDK